MRSELKHDGSMDDCPLCAKVRSRRAKRDAILLGIAGAAFIAMGQLVDDPLKGIVITIAAFPLVFLSMLCALFKEELSHVLDEDG